MYPRDVRSRGRPNASPGDRSIDARKPSTDIKLLRGRMGGRLDPLKETFHHSAGARKSDLCEAYREGPGPNEVNTGRRQRIKKNVREWDV